MGFNGQVGGTDLTGLCSWSCATVSVRRQPSGVTSQWGISGFGLHITFEVRKESHIPNRVSTATLGPSKFGGCTIRAALATVIFELRLPNPSITQAIWPRHVGVAAADLATSKFGKYCSSRSQFTRTVIVTRAANLEWALLMAGCLLGASMYAHGRPQ